MARAADTLDQLHGLFDDGSVRDLLVTASGEVYLGTESGRRPSSLSLTGATVAALAELLSVRASAATSGSPAFTAHLGSALWTVLRPPLSASLALMARRCPRRRPMLGDFVDNELMGPEIARRLVETVREGRNLLVAAPDHFCAVTVLDALLTLGSPGQLALYIGDARAVDASGTDTTVIDRAALDELQPGAATEAAFEMLRQARSVFIERLAAPRDLFWWFGGDAFARGRIGAMCAPSTEVALTQLGELHRALHRAHQGPPSEGLVDAVLFVEHLRPGRGQTFNLAQLGSDPAATTTSTPYTASDSSPRIKRVQSRPVSATAVSAVVVADTPADTYTRPQASRPASDEHLAAHRRNRSNPRLPRPTSGEFSATAASASPAEPHDDLALGRTGSMPRLDKPDTAPVPHRPDSTPAAPPSEAAATSSKSGVDSFGDFGDIFADEELHATPPQPTASESADASSSLFRPGELDDLLGDDDATSSPAPAAATDARDEGFARHTARSGTRTAPPGSATATTSSSRYDAATTRHDAEQIRASRYRPETSSSPTAPGARPRPGASSDAMRGVRRPTPSPLPAYSAPVATPPAAQTPPPAREPSPPPASADRWAAPNHSNSVSASGGRPIVGRGAPTRQRVARPATSDVPLSSADIEFIDEQPPGSFDPSFMQEGTLGDDVVGDFSSEPTRRAQWPKDGG